MEITIKNAGSRYIPTWEFIQTMIRELTGDASCVLTRINRRDRGVCYRDPGVYDLTVRRTHEEMPVVLTVS